MGNSTATLAEQQPTSTPERPGSEGGTISTATQEPVLRIATPDDKLKTALTESQAERNSELAAETADLDERIEHHAEWIDELKTRSIENMLEVGCRLTAIHKLLAGSGREGQFRPWLKERIGMSHQTAYNAINAYATFGGEKCKPVLHFLDLKATYLLSAESCPEKATKEAIRRAKKGERITSKLAKELRGKHTPTAETPAAEEVFDLPTALTRLKKMIRAEVAGWPAEHNQEAANCLEMVVEELWRSCDLTGTPE